MSISIAIVTYSYVSVSCPSSLLTVVDLNLRMVTYGEGDVELLNGPAFSDDVTPSSPSCSKFLLKVQIRCTEYKSPRWLPLIVIASFRILRRRRHPGPPYCNILRLLFPGLVSNFHFVFQLVVVGVWTHFLLVRRFHCGPNEKSLFTHH